MKVLITVLLLLVCPWCESLEAQDRPSSAENPLAQLKDEVKRVLGEANLPFTQEQETGIILMMEDRRKASEDLFGGLMDFRAGPTSGEEADRLRSAIAWMSNEFIIRLQDYLRPEQLAAWSRSRETAEQSGANADAPRGQAPQRQQSQTQFVRINNNSFTSEEAGYRIAGNRGGQQSGPEVIQRGGGGAFHGNAQLLLKDESLNAGRRFANNKPPYQERRTSFDFGGPVVPGKLTTTFAFNQTEAENVDVVRATLPDGIFSLGVTRPTLNRSFSLRNTYQLSDGHTLSLNGGYATNHSENQGIGGFNLPERASNSSGQDWNIELRQFSALSSRAIYETRVNFANSRDNTTPATSEVKINVTDAFNKGGAQNGADTTGRTYNFSNLYTRLGEKLTLKTGFDAVYRANRTRSEPNFIGTFSFSGLDAFQQGRPLTFRVTRGNSLLETNQWDLSFFLQNDLKVTPRFTLMYGARYEIQTNISDPNNLGPRLGISYAVGPATVIRAGSGIFHERIPINVIENQHRLDGKHQYEIVIDNPSYPDPFQSGTVRNTFPSVRVTDPDIATPYNFISMVSYERTFLSTLFISAALDYSKEVHRVRNHNINAPMDITSPVPRSCSPGQSKETCVRPQPDRGNIINLESTGAERALNFRLNFRQRFSIFNVSANYTTDWRYTDSSPNGGSTSVSGGSDLGGFGAEGLPSNNYNLGEDWTNSFRPIHTLSNTVNAQLPLGIFLTETMSYDSGRKYTITTGKDDNQDSSANDRPPGVGRNSGQAPNFLSFSFNISKAFFFGVANGNTRKNINLFANMTNAFNRPNYNPPSGVMTSPNFGKSTTATAPREIEVGLRFQF